MESDLLILGVRRSYLLMSGFVPMGTSGLNHTSFLCGRRLSHFWTSPTGYF